MLQSKAYMNLKGPINCSTPSGLAGFGKTVCSPWVSPTANQIKPLWGLVTIFGSHAFHT